jgi:hypothetical protein
VQISVRRYLLIAAACCSEPQQAFERWFCTEQEAVDAGWRKAKV